MKLGNYKWVMCPKCKQKYAVVPGKESNHKCKTNWWNKLFGK